jgi:hypothetical protein
MRKRLVGAFTLCLTAASFAWAEEGPPGKLPEPGSLPPVVGEVKAPSAANPSAATTGEPPSAKFELPEQIGAPQVNQSPARPPQPAQPQPDQPQPGPMGTTPATGDQAQAQNGMQTQANGAGTAKKPDLKDEHPGPWYTYWASAEYLHWWTKPGSITVPLLTVNNGPLVLGNSDIDYEDRSGGRITAGAWLDGQHIYGLEASGFLLARPTISATFSSDAGGNPTLSRPIVNALTGAPTFVLVSSPGAFAGSLTTSSESRLWGLEANVVRNLACQRHFDADLLFGFRYLDLDENLKINQTSTVLGNSTIPFPGLTGTAGSTVSLLDSFSTRNQLFAGQIGGRFELKAGCWTVEGLAKVALGPMHEALTIQGSSTLVTPTGASSTANGGLLAQFAPARGLDPGANIGHTSTNWFTIAPEVEVQLGYQITENLRLQFGYNFLYVNNVIRPGNQINTTINPQLVPALGGPGFGPAVGPLEPHTLFRQQEFWAHGITAGVAFRY